jgi:uncharacterized protein
VKLAEGLSLHESAVTDKLAFLGRTGSGKTYAAMKLAELFLTEGAQIVVLDPVGAWYGLRIGGSFSVYIFGGMHGDYPLSPTSGKLMAELIVDRGVCAVLDISMFIRSEQIRFAEDFIQQFFERRKAKPAPIHVFLEECQEFVPQNPQRDEPKMLHHFERAWKIGRNYGIGGSLISQRPQEINKKVLNQTGMLFAFQMTGPQEREAIQKWTKEVGIQEDIQGMLPSLKVGSPHVWSPAPHPISKVVTILPKITADVSATPKLGSRVKERPLSPIDVEKLNADMAATIERAKSDDPKELRKQIAELKKQLAARPEAAKAEVKEIPVFRPEDVQVLTGCFDMIRKEFTQSLLKHAQVTGVYFERIQKLLAEANAKVPGRPPMVKPAQNYSKPITPRKPKVESTGSGGDITDGTQQRTLDTIAMLNARGIPVTREAVARWMGIHPNGGRFLSGLAALRANGYLDGWNLTDSGEKAARLINTGIEAAVAALIDGTCKRSFEELVAAHPQALSREQLAERMGIHPNGGRFLSGLSWLRQMGLITERSPIAVQEGAFQ